MVSCQRRSQYLLLHANHAQHLNGMLLLWRVELVISRASRAEVDCLQEIAHRTGDLKLYNVWFLSNNHPRVINTVVKAWRMGCCWNEKGGQLLEKIYRITVKVILHECSQLPDSVIYIRTECYPFHEKSR